MTITERVLEFERRLGFRLPDDYRQFLLTHTNSSLAPSLAFRAPRSGSIDTLLTVDDLILNDDHRRIGIPEKSLMHIGSNILGGYLYLDVSEAALGVVRYMERYVFCEHFSSFTVFLEQTEPEADH